LMTSLLSLATAADKSSNATGPQSSNTTKAQAFPRPDLTVQPVSETKIPMFVVKNVGASNAAQSIVQVQCVTQPAAAAGEPCMPNLHYVNVPAAPPSPGTMMTAPNVWRIPVGPLSASGGEVKLHVSVISKANQVNGLKFSVCADATAVIVESSEANNCSNFVFKPPQ
jgi:hypothetical protein